MNLDELMERRTMLIRQLAVVRQLDHKKKLLNWIDIVEALIISLDEKRIA